MAENKLHIEECEPLDLNAMDRAGILIRALMDDSVSPELKARLRGWFADETNEEAKEKAFMNYSETIQPNEKQPSEESRKRFGELAARLAIPTSASVPAPAVRPAKRRPVWQWTAAAAAVVVLVGVGLLFINKNTDIPEETLVATGESAQEIILPDNSRVIVGPNSSLTYSDSFEQGREVILKGEAFFCVNADSANLFIVHTDELKVKVFGTDFRVNSHADAEAYEIKLYEGHVAVEIDGHEYEIEYGKKLDVNRITYAVDQDYISLEEMLEGGYKPRLHFESVSLTDVFRAIEAHYEVTIEVADNVKRMADSAEIYADLEGCPMETALAILKEINGSFSYRMNDTTINVTK